MAFAYTNNTSFRPFSYQEMLAPIIQATQAHQEIENTYNELDSQANAVGALANEADDPVTFSKYKSFEKSLRNQANLLASQGLSPNSRRALNDIRTYYAKEITPIQNAVSRRRILADEQRKALLQNPTLMFQRNFNEKGYNTSLDRFIDNPEYDYGSSYSGALLIQQVAQAASNLAKELTSHGNGKRLDAYTKTFMQQHGFTREQVLDAINNPNREQSQPVLNAIVENTIKASGMPKWADDATMSKAYNYARQGLWSAIGQTNINPYDDTAAKLAAQERTNRSTQDASTSPTNNTPPTNNVALNPIPIYSQRKLSADQQKYESNIKKYAKYFKNGKLTEEGWAAYKKNPLAGTWGYDERTNTVAAQGYTIRMSEDAKKSEFKKFMDSVGFKPSNTGGYGPNQAIQAYRKYNSYKENNPSAQALQFDANRAIEYSYDLPTTPEAQTQFKSKMVLANANQKKFYVVDLKEDGTKWEKTGKSISKEDLLDNKKYTVMARRPSELGTTVMVIDNEGNTLRLEMPRGINPTAEDNRDIAIQNRLIVQRALLDESLSDDERSRLEAAYNQYAQEQQLYESQLDYINKTKNQEFNPYAF